MSRLYLDTIFLYLHLRQGIEDADPRVARWREHVWAELEDGTAVISPLVVDELAYRMLLAWLRDDGVADPLSRFRSDPAEVTKTMATRLRSLWRDVDRLRLEMLGTDHRVVGRAQRMMASPGLAPRDAFHAASALDGRCDVIVSSDAAFDRVRALARLGPPDP